ncbi:MULTISPECIES: cupin domain-containing protein [Streptomyces]|uniref:cupin domain-containing protein n=1 Tax=Streptomyces TaxID=1883 RepID=UPI00163CA397|nr:MULTISPECIES: cupin domain-containing protein [Streptomyces]MBC2874658.1 cupin domain-containing protein [Streptomyces sp. TYQ1024]UBI36577.1 cupin domain-containing protein [Streptomyces mobaraensis]UKW29168.1 cupin domain-containing protein [Streptomyces sp. TYQ1024]
MTVQENAATTPGTDEDARPNNRVHHVRAGELDGYTALSGHTVGSKKLWMGMVENPPLSATDNHHHGASEAGIFVVSGHPVFVFHDGTEEVRITAGPGDFLLVPPFVPHREENPSADEPVVVVIARTTQEPIKVSVPELYQLTELPAA